MASDRSRRREIRNNLGLFLMVDRVNRILLRLSRRIVINDSPSLDVLLGLRTLMSPASCIVIVLD